MIAAYDAQFAQQTTTPPASQTPAPAAETPKDPPADTAPTETPPDPKDPDAPKDGETPPTAPSLVDLFKDGGFQTALTAEKVPEAFVDGLAQATGQTAQEVSDFLAQYKAGLAAIQELATQKIHALAGGKDAFNALNTWAQANLTAEQRDYFNDQLNGPMAGEAMAVLKQRMNAGKDPQVTLGSGTTAPVVTGFRSQAEMVAAMSDPRYKAGDLTYHAEVAEKLKRSTF